jgi:hypothetical protein
MVKDAKIRVVLDTRQAEQDLHDLGREGENTASRVGQNTRGGGGGGGGGGRGGGGRGAGGGSRGGGGSGGMFRKGAMAGFGFGVGRRISGAVGIMGSIGEVVTETFSGQAADFDKWIGAAKARAMKGAREETAQNMALMTYHTGDTEAAKSYYNQVLQVKHLPQQMGGAEIQKRLAGGRAESPDGMGLIDKLIDRITGAVKDGFNGIIGALGG